jgi:hypothetical protein
MPHYTDQQFNQLLEMLIQYKKCCPDRVVTLSEKSLKKATEYFMKTGIFDEDFLEQKEED